MSVQQDGLGTRRAAFDERWGGVEVLDVTPELGNPIAELAIRAAVARQPRSGSVLAPVHAVERDGTALRIISAAPDGRRLSDILRDLEAQSLRLPDEAILELAAMVVTAVRWLHEMPGAPCHGALSPHHLVLRENGQLLLTDGIFAEPLSKLRANPERLWRQFGIALPVAANDPVFDQQADVTGAGAIILALLLRRPLRPAEYPHALADLIMAGTIPLPEWGSSLRGWLQQVLQLRAPFSTSGEAIGAFAGVLQVATRRREGARALLSELFAPVRVG